jgi:chemotaxis protein methyltransferase CheR
MSQIALDDKDLKDIADIVYDTCGIVFKDSNLTVLSSRLSTKLKEKNLNSSAYLRLLRTDKTELMGFIDFVTTNFTSFFRNIRHFEMMQEDILPEVIRQNAAKKTITIWSAGCSSGEEPYTIAMVMNEFFESHRLASAGWTYQVIGSDISLESLFVAKEGRFPARSVEKIERKYLEHYLVQNGDSFVVKEDLKRQIRFDYHNLIYDNGLRDIDIAFCRNVLIYFDQDIQKRVVANIFQAVRPGGYFFIGHSESLIGLFEGFKPANFNKGVIYVRQ